MNFIAIDFETANFKSSSACALGIAVVENGVIKETKSYLFQPNPNYFENFHSSIHGITLAQVKGKPDFLQLWTEILPYFQNKTLIAHNASFDFSVLRSVLDVYGAEYPTLDYYCSMLLSKKSIDGLVNYKLPTLCKYFNIGLNHHDAESDAKACAQLTIELCEKHNATTLIELAEILNFKNGKLYATGYKPFSNYIRKSNVRLELLDETTEFDTENPFYGKIVVFTGALSKIPRRDAQQLVLRSGGKCKNSVTSDTNYLVVGTYDFKQFGEGFESESLKKAKQFIEKGFDLEIISETDFFSMVSSENTLFEITLALIEKDSEIFLRRNKYNDFADKRVYFSSDLAIDRLHAFQMVGSCGGIGHDYDTDTIVDSEYFVVSNKTIELLKAGAKSKCLIDYEQIRSKASSHGSFPDTRIIDEKTFLYYMKLREQFQRGEIKMNIYEWDISKNRASE